MIKSLNLINFRNLKEKNLDFNNPLVIIKGPNATGKTSILEAIYLASTAKSHRTNNYKEMINKEANTASISLKTDKELKIILDNEKKNYFINDRPLKNVDFLGSIKAVMFSSLDLKTITGSNSDKRKFLDINLSLMDNRYLNWLITYRKLLKKRNECLKAYNPDLKLIKVITDELIIYTKEINNYRTLFLNRINQKLIEITK